MKNFRKQFPILDQTTYLDTAALGLLSESVLEFRQEHDLDFFISGSGIKEQHDRILTRTREAVGKHFTCDPRRIALAPNFSYGFNILMEGIRSGQKVLLLENDYPSVNWAVEARDFETYYVKIDEHLEKNISEAVEKEKPDVFAFSLVQYINGIKIDPDFLDGLKKQFPDLLLLADGTQYCGTEDFDFDASSLDVLGASAYKWLNAGFGNAFFLFRGNMSEKIAPRTLGFDSLQGKYKPHEGSLIGKFEPGHLDTLNFGSLLTALQLIEKTGKKEIEAHIGYLAAEAKKALGKAGFLEEAVMKRELHSPIFNIKGNRKLFDNLKSRNIICSQRGEGIRVSFHYYNTSEDLDILMKALK